MRSAGACWGQYSAAYWSTPDEGVPPDDRVVNDRQIDRPDQHEDPGGTSRQAAVVEGVPEGNNAAINKQQHQLRSQTGIPDPPVPHIGLPHAAPLTSAIKVQTAPTGASAATLRSAILTCQTMPTKAAAAIAA